MSSSRPEVGDRVPAAEATVAAALRAFELKDWEALVDLTDMDSVATLKMKYVEAKQVVGDAFRGVVERMAADAEDATWKPSPWKAEFQEGFDQEFARLMAQQREDMMKRLEPVELAGITSFKEVEALTPAAFLIRWAQARHPELVVEGSPASAWVKPSRRIVVGSVAILPDTVAVVVRETIVPPAEERFGAVTEPHWVSGHSLIAVLGNNRGQWSLNAEASWLGLIDLFG